ncbi:MAG: hypothetical protein ABIQ01_13310 [Pseudolysinimonas sp.]
MSDDAEFLESAFFGAHRAIPVPAFPDADPQDAVQIVRARTLPRHRARRRQWKPPVARVVDGSPLEPAHVQNAHDGKAFLR